MKRYIKSHPTQQELHDKFRYCVSGNLYWKMQPSNNVDLSKPAGCIRNDGYITIRINSKDFFLHRLIYIYHNGDIPNDLLIDHKDDDHTNNKITNLQAISNQSNITKQRKSKNNKSGYRGVFWSSRNKKWMAQIRYNYKNTYIGLFDDKEEAAKAYDKVAMQYFGEFAKLNFN